MNFALILFLLTVLTGVMWIAEKFYFRPRRQAQADANAREFEAANREAIDRGEVGVNKRATICMHVMCVCHGGLITPPGSSR